MSEHSCPIKCPALEPSKCPMKDCPYLDELKSKFPDKDVCPYKHTLSKCPYFNGSDANTCPAVCPLKTNCPIKNCIHLNSIKECPLKKDTNCPYLEKMKS